MVDERLKQSVALFFLLIAASVLAGVAQAGPVFNRQPNTTLRMPQYPQPPSHSYVVKETLGSLAFDKPVGFAVEPGETNRLFIVERTGRIIVITNMAKPTRTVFMDITSKVYSDFEFGFAEGLSSMAFHPGYATNRYFFVTYTMRTNVAGVWKNYNRLARFKRSSSNRNLGVSSSETPFITQLDEGDGHNMNDLQFGSNGYLYVAIGDEGDGGSGDDHNNAQRIDKDFFSGILKIDVDKRPGNRAPNPHPAATQNYYVPANNPFVGVTSFNGQPVDPAKVRTEFYAVGFRNPWRIFVDKTANMIYAGDVGQHGREEVNVIFKGGNYGWAYKEGTIAGPKGSPPPGVSLRNPIAEYSPGYGANQGMAVIGGVVYRGNRIPSLAGYYVFADYVSGNIWALKYQGSTPTSFQRLTGRDGIAGFGLDPRNGDVLMADHKAGKILKLDYVVDSTGSIPPTLAETGVFSNLQSLTVNPGIVAYDVNVPFWSDNAIKRRWFSLPDTNLKIGFNKTNNWTFPASTVWIKHFELELNHGDPQSRRRLETRLIVKTDSGVYGVTYRWGTSTANASLVPDGGMNETFTVYSNGVARTQVWRYPSRNECLSCHTPVIGFAPGFNTPQLNRNHTYGSTSTNQLYALSSAGYFNTVVTDFNSLTKLAGASNTAYSREYRVRSYLAANCAHCHQPGGTGRGYWDARITTAFSSANIINGPLQNYYGNLNNRVIDPGNTAYSMLLTRIKTLSTQKMPPLGSSVLNGEAIKLVSDWVMYDLARPWEAVGAHDFNHNNTADLVVQKKDRSLQVHYLNGATRVGTNSIRNGLPVSSSWRFAGIDDFNANGSKDFLWQNSDGRLYLWFMNGATFGSERVMRDGKAAGTGWFTAGTGDFNWDDSPDILFQHADRRMAVWTFSKTNFQNSIYIDNGTPSPADWLVAGVGEFNSDGSSDILLRHTKGNVAAWLMNGTSHGSSINLRNGMIVSQEWRVVAVTSFDPGLRNDIVWQNQKTGSVMVWVMNGTTYVKTVNISP